MASTGKRGRTDIEFDVDEFLAATATQGTNMDSVIMGIDEAGRGPALGDMVYCGAFISLHEHHKLLDCGVADSKMLTEANRESCRTSLEALSTLVPIIRPLSAQYIADTMYSRGGRNLNTISHETAISMIHEATLKAGGKLCAVYVDTVGPPDSYKRLLQGRFPHLNITVAKKADSKYPIVSAASIFAKTTRDRTIVASSKIHGPLGSGYPADPNTVKFLRSHLHKVFTFTPEFDFVRHSWAPVASLAQKACVPMQFAHEDEKDGAPTASALRSQVKLTDMGKHRTDMVYSTMLGLTVAGGDVLQMT